MPPKNEERPVPVDDKAQIARMEKAISQLSQTVQSLTVERDAALELLNMRSQELYETMKQLKAMQQ